MFLGKVIGTVWSTVKWPQLSGLKLLLVRPYDLAELRQISAGHRSKPLPPSYESVVCADLMDAGVGDDVVIAYGHAARVAAWDALNRPDGSADPAAFAQAPPIPIDAAIVAVVDNINVDQVP